MKKFLLYTLVVIKNATIILPFFEGMISALAQMVEADDKKKLKQQSEKSDEVSDVVDVESVETK